MEFSPIDSELIRLAIFIGILASAITYKRYGVTMGAAIVPGFLASYLYQPSRILATMGLATIVYAVVYQQLRPRLMLWGQRLLAMEILVGLVLQILAISLVALMGTVEFDSSLLAGIGFLLPAIIAHDMGRQGYRRTTIAILTGTLLVGSLLWAVQLLPAAYLQIGRDAVATPTFSTLELFLAILVSVLVGVAFYRGLFLRLEKLRAGGFITPAYLALLLDRPVDILFVLVGSVITYLIVTQLLQPRLILFGRIKVATMLLVGLVVAWGLELILVNVAGYAPWVEFHVIGPLLIALLANDSERQGIKRTALGAAVATGIIAILLALLRFAG